MRPRTTREELALLLPAAAPHLDAAALEELLEAYLGTISWQSARAAVS